MNRWDAIKKAYELPKTLCATCGWLGLQANHCGPGPRTPSDEWLAAHFAKRDAELARLADVMSAVRRRP